MPTRFFGDSVSLHFYPFHPAWPSFKWPLQATGKKPAPVPYLDLSLLAQKRDRNSVRFENCHENPEVSSQIGVPLFGYPQIIPGHETHTVTWGSTPSLKIRITRLGPKVCGSRGSHKNFGLTFGPFVAIRCGMVNNSCQTWNIIIQLRWIWRYSVYQRLNFLRVWSFSFL